MYNTGLMKNDYTDYVDVVATGHNPDFIPRPEIDRRTFRPWASGVGTTRAGGIGSEYSECRVRVHCRSSLLHKGVALCTPPRVAGFPRTYILDDTRLFGFVEKPPQSMDTPLQTALPHPNLYAMPITNWCAQRRLLSGVFKVVSSGFLLVFLSFLVALQPLELWLDGPSFSRLRKLLARSKSE